MAAHCLPGKLAVWTRGHRDTGGDPTLEWPDNAPPKPRDSSHTWRGPHMVWGPCAPPGLGKSSWHGSGGVPMGRPHARPGPPSSPAGEGNRQSWSRSSRGRTRDPRELPSPWRPCTVLFKGAFAQCTAGVPWGSLARGSPGVRDSAAVSCLGFHKHFRAPHLVLLYYN